MDCFLIQIPAEEQPAFVSSDGVAIQGIVRRSEQGHRRLELGESWAGLHFLLTWEVPIPRHEALRLGISWEDDSLEHVLLGGAPVPYDTSWGPARYLEPGLVARMASRLSNISREQFQERYDPEALEDERIPPGGWEDPDTRAWLVDCYVKLVGFYQSAAAKRSGVLCCLI